MDRVVLPIKYSIYKNQFMKLKDSSAVLAASALVILGAVLGGFGSYQLMDKKFDSLEQKVSEPKKVVHVNSSDRNEQLSGLFQQIDQSVVSVSTIGTENAEGSGFVYSERGHIVTNDHVIEGADKVKVTFTDGSTVDAKIVGTDSNNDLAVLRVDKNNLEPLSLGSLDNVSVGQTAVAVGNPFGLRGTMTSGIISQKGRMIPTDTGFSIPNVLQTDAAINPGNSGGPLLNIEGQVVGVNTAIESRTGTFSGIGFAIPVNVVKNVVPDIINEGDDFEYPWLGVSGFSVTPEIADAMNLSNASGFLVVNVIEDGPADEAGIRESNTTVKVGQNNLTVGGDVITGINSNEMTGIGDILTYLQSGPEVGDEVNVTVIREGEKVEVPVTLGSRSEAESVR